MQLEAAGVGVNKGILRHISVIDHAVFAVGNEGVDFNIVVCGEPLMQGVFAVSSPKDGAVEYAAVLKGVGQTGNIYASAATKIVGGHLYFLILLNQDVGSFVGIDVLAEHRAIERNECICQPPYIQNDTILPLKTKISLSTLPKVLGRSSGERNGNPLQYSCLGNSMDREAYRATVHGVTKSQT